jgi:hypothetical protein
MRGNPRRQTHTPNRRSTASRIDQHRAFNRPHRHHRHRALPKPAIRRPRMHTLRPRPLRQVHTTSTHQNPASITNTHYPANSCYPLFGPGGGNGDYGAAQLGVRPRERSRRRTNVATDSPSSSTCGIDSACLSTLLMQSIEPIWRTRSSALQGRANPALWHRPCQVAVAESTCGKAQEAETKAYSSLTLRLHSSLACRPFAAHTTDIWQVFTN